MKASVAPISLLTSISSLWVRICSRMVLNVTATRPKREQRGRRISAHAAKTQQASTRFTQAESSWTWATLGQLAFSSGSRPTRRRRSRTSVDHERVGQGIVLQRGDDLGQSLGALEPASACSRGTNRTPARRGVAQAASTRRHRRVSASGARNRLICGSWPGGLRAAPDWREARMRPEAGPARRRSPAR